MKKTVLLIVFALVGMIAIAQRGPHVGLVATFGPSFVVDQHVYGNTEPAHIAFRFSQQAGLQAGFNFTKNLGVFAEFSMAKLGAKWYEDADQQDWTRELDFKYFLVPVVLKYTSGQGNTRFFAEAGLQFGMLRGVTQTYTGDLLVKDVSAIVNPSVTNPNERFNGDITERFEDNDIGLTMTLGANIDLSEGFYLNLGLRLNGGLKDINKDGWRQLNHSNEYEMSRHLWGGLHIGAVYNIPI